MVVPLSSMTSTSSSPRPAAGKAAAASLSSRPPVTLARPEHSSTNMASFDPLGPGSGPSSMLAHASSPSSSSQHLPLPLRTAEAFSFPYATPYSIQLDLMSALFDAVEHRKIGVFESPTGTGKSLSLICGVFTWWRANAERTLAGLVEGTEGDGQGDDDDEPEWVKQQSRERKLREARRGEEELRERIRAVRQKEAELRRRAAEAAKRDRAALSGGRQPSAKKPRLDGSKLRSVKGTGSDDDSGSEDEEAFLPSDPSSSAPRPSWHSLGPATSMSSGADPDEAYLSPAVRALMAQLSGGGGKGPNGKDDIDELPETKPKIIYASRTHSQLSQFVAELKKTAFGREVDVDTVRGDDADEQRGPVRVIPLGSRKQMCIHEGVQKIGAKAGSEAMNEACRELITSSGSKGKKKRCEFLPPMDEAGKAQVLEFRDRAMAQVRDIEDLVEMGREMETCPYYAARTAARQANLVTLPYNLLLQKDARESLGVDMQDAVVLVDEAHNLIDTILSVHSATITSAQVSTAKGQINEYLRRFGAKLRGESEVQLRTLRRLLEGLERATLAWGRQARARAKTAKGGDIATEEVWTAAHIVAQMGGNLDTVNFAELERFLKDSQIARKVSSYAEKRAKTTAAAAAASASAEKAADSKRGKGSRMSAPLQRRVTAPGQAQKQAPGNVPETDKAATGGELPPSAIAAMHSIEAFILSLSNRTRDGRVLLTLLPPPPGSAPGPNGTDTTADADVVVQLKYQLLNPAESFSSLVSSARSIVLAGGTMAPVSDIRTQLVPSLLASRWTTFSCGHIVPRENLFCSVVPCGPRGSTLEMTYGKRGDPATLDDLGNALANLVAVVPHGVVAFFPSYKVLDGCVERWKGTGLWTRLAARKALFTEPKAAADVDATLQAYRLAIEGSGSAGGASTPSGTGALLLAVVGAKLSEGINFSDRLARAVIMVGLPFPNAKSPELAERMRYVRETSHVDANASAGVKDAGQALYLSLCLKAVNQSIGRAIRHQNDFAALLLLDVRYGRSEIRQGLPGWIQDAVRVPAAGAGFGTVMRDLGAWWREKKAKGMV